jgi:hypothetical protein
MAEGRGMDWGWIAFNQPISHLQLIINLKSEI